MRMESQPFTDELAHKLTPPEEDIHAKWQQKVEKQFKKIYGISIDKWRENALVTRQERN